MLDRAGRYEVDGYVYNTDEEPKLLITGKWNTSMSYQPCDLEGEPLPGTELKQVSTLSIRSFVFTLFLVSAFLPFKLGDHFLDMEHSRSTIK